MICQHCGKSVKSLKVDKNGTPKPISFCCYECYLEFWKGCKEFVPLAEYIPNPKLDIPNNRYTKLTYYWF